MTFISAYWQADFFGKLIFFGLFVLSLVSWFFIVHKIWMLHVMRKSSYSFQAIVEKNKDAVLNLSYENLPQLSNRQVPHPFANLFLILKRKTVEILDKNNFFASGDNYLSHADVDLIESHLATTMSRQKERLDKNLFVLSTTVTLAPFLGLLGTVWGILVTFSELQKGGSIASNAVVLGGLSTALTTTVLGLLIAIPALIAYNYLKNVHREFYTEMYDFSHLLLSTIELQYRKVDVQ